jgi:hypothetical protein
VSALLPLSRPHKRRRRQCSTARFVCGFTFLPLFHLLLAPRPQGPSASLPASLSPRSLVRCGWPAPAAAAAHAGRLPRLPGACVAAPSGPTHVFHVRRLLLMRCLLALAGCSPSCALAVCRTRIGARCHWPGPKSAARPGRAGGWTVTTAWLPWFQGSQALGWLSVSSNKGGIPAQDLRPRGGPHPTP